MAHARSRSLPTSSATPRLTSLALALLCCSGCSTLFGTPSASQPAGADPPGTPAPHDSDELRSIPLGRPTEIPSTPGSLSAIHFAHDSSTLDAGARAELQRHAAFLADAPPDTRVRLEGHCDEHGTNEYNLALGARRAEAVHRYLVALGVDPSGLETLSFGEELPADLGHDEAAWARNRRVELRPYREPTAAATSPPDGRW